MQFCTLYRGEGTQKAYPACIEGIFSLFLTKCVYIPRLLIIVPSEQLHKTWDLVKRLMRQHPECFASPKCQPEGEITTLQVSRNRMEWTSGFYVLPVHSQVRALQHSQGKANPLTPWPCFSMYVNTSRQEQFSYSALGFSSVAANLDFTHLENFRTNLCGSIVPCLELLADCTTEDDRWVQPDKLICVAEIKTDKLLSGAMMRHLHILTSFLM